MKSPLSIFAPFLLLVAGAIAPLHAQGKFGHVSPITADFVRYGETPVSLFTGQLNLEIPIYRIKDADFDIPISLAYTADGFKPEKRSDFVGLDWTLIAGGCITREVYGAADESISYSTYQPYGFLQTVKRTKNTFTKADVWEAKNNAVQKSYDASPQYYMWVNGHIADYQPDLFLFNANGHSGQFMINNDGVAQSGQKGYKIDITKLSDQFVNMVEPSPSSISITTPDGYLYEFGGELDALEYTMNFTDNESIDPYSLDGPKTNTTILAWHLRRITAPNGRTVEFTYVPTPNGFYSKRRDPLWQSGRTKPVQSEESPKKVKYVGIATKKAILSAITVDNVTVEFNKFIEGTLMAYSDRGFFPLQYNYNASTYQLNDITVRYNGTLKYHYWLQYTDKDRRRFLSKITLPEGTSYQFSYNHPTAYPEPDKDSEIDLVYGYWTKNNSENSHGLLSSVTYPLGGQTSFTYESHTYSRAVEINLSRLSKQLVSASTNTYNYKGARIKKVIHYIDNTKTTQASEKEYLYTEIYNPNSASSGILYQAPPYHTLKNGSKSYSLNDTWNRNYNIGEPAIGYSCVYEKNVDGSYTEYRFYDYEDNPDNNNDNPNYRDSELRFLVDVTPDIDLLAATGHNRITSNADKRGLLKEKRIYTSDGEEKQYEKWTYANLSTRYRTPPPYNDDDIVSFQPMYGGGVFRIHRLKTWHPVLTRDITTDGVTRTEVCTYNKYDLTASYCTVIGKTDTLKTSYTYPFQETGAPYTAMKNANMLSTVITEVTTVKHGTSEQEIQRIRTNYIQDNTRTHGLILPDKRLTSFSGAGNLKVDRTYNSYDERGYLTAYTTANGTTTVQHWDAEGYPQAEIRNATLEEVNRAWNATTGTTEARYSALRTALPYAHISNYTYSPLIGCTQETAPNGKKMVYEYNDPAKRLTKIAHQLSSGSEETQQSIAYYTGDRNYIRTRAWLTQSGNSSLYNRTYYDGLGRPFETVQETTNLITLQEYDNVGRESKLWLPIASSANYASPEGIKSVAPGNYNNDSRPYHQSTYEPSALNRITQQHGPGRDWNAHPIATAYLTNSGSAPLNCIRYTVNAAGALVNNGNYAAGQLFVTRTTDEDGHVSYTFVDKRGQLVLSRQMDNNVAHDTYYVYDDWGNKRFVLQPMYQENPDLSLYAFQYKYDHRNRCIEKKIPGAEPIKYVYDMADHLTFSQDGSQRSVGRWTFYLYDAFNRLVLQCECGNSNTASVENMIVTSSWSPSNDELYGTGYTANIEIIEPSFHLANYYDTYDFRSLPLFSNSIYQEETSDAKGYLTGNLMMILRTYKEIPTVNYYDVKGQLIKSVSDNHLGGHEVTTTDYTFTGNPGTVEHTHTAAGKATITEKYAYTYDHIDRLTKVEHQLNDNPVVTLSENTYDALGRLKTKQQHGSQWLTSTYTYNIRNWLTRIRSYHFYQDLYYTENHHGNTPLYNGNISSMQWQMNGKARGYNYSYDQLNRLTDAVYSENEDFDTGIGSFSVKGCRYDKNGNLLAMMRYGKIWNNQHDLIDDLSLSYNGNQLKTANDAVTKPPLLHDSFEFFDNDNHEKTEYWYDSAGSLTADLNKGISFIYNNSLYLPYFVQFSNGNCLTNEYSVDGMKRRVTHYTAIPNISVPMRQFRELKDNEILHRTTTDYCGNVIYEDGNLKMILTEEGFITMENGAPLYHYYVKDYQGNNRMVIKADDHMDGRAEQYNHYYPFGGVFETDNNSSTQPYKYNGKELDRMFGLNWYDYDARTMDPLLGRFNSIDPLAEMSPNISPYVYCNNNPIRYVDPTGMKFTDRAQDEVDRLRKEIERRKKSNDKRIKREQEKLKEEGLSDKKRKKIMKRISNIDRRNSELDATNTELNILAESDQVYDVEYDSSMEMDDGLTRITQGSTSFDRANGTVVIKLGSRNLGLLAHELKHAYQFEIGAYSIGHRRDGSPFYDQSDEIEAYARGAFFGASRIFSLPEQYSRLSVGPIDATSLAPITLATPAALQRIADKNWAIFRINGVTYIGKEL